MNSSYRRPQAGGESDHGYSTMTPHEDSEIASSTACLEPLIIGRDRYRPSSTALPKGSDILPPPPSKDRLSRSPTPPGIRRIARSPSPTGQTVLPSSSPPPGQTVLPEEPHQILANVTVHMVDSH